ncbi:MAG: alpha/beta hydrolase [Gammaproteobacteria bacterium]|nr:alpha/beta hydrolase [Gammaproteobacteria bacterium]
MSETPDPRIIDAPALTSTADIPLGVSGRLLNLLLRATVKTHLRGLQTNADGVARMRLRVDQLVNRFGHVDDELTAEYTDIGGVPCETLCADSGATTVLLYIHGGAFLACSPRSHWGITRPLARHTRCRVVAVDYRLTPEHPYPAALEDVMAVYRELVHRHGAGRIAIAGDSAGGNLVLSLMHAAQAAELPLPACAVCLSPWTDLCGTGTSVTNNVALDPMLPADRMRDAAHMYLGNVHPRVPTASPLYGAFNDFPPLLFHVGTTEILLDDTLRVVAKARAVGVEAHLRIWPDYPHVFHIFSSHLTGARVALREISDFVVSKLSARNAGD